MCDKPAAGAALHAANRSADAPVFRDATIDDLPRLLQIEAQFPGDRLSPRQFRHHLRRGARIRVVENAGHIVGYSLVLLRRRSSWKSITTPRRPTAVPTGDITITTAAQA